MKILVAGAGHGGLAAAALLAKDGHSVTVFEKNTRGSVGYDWEDRFTFSLLSDITKKDIPESEWRYRGDCAFVSPDYKTKVVIKYTPENRQKIMGRKYIIRSLIEYAEARGVEFCFNAAVQSPVIEDAAVKGLIVDGKEYRSDLVIDAAGVFSPVRSNLPAEFGIEKMPLRGDVFYACRVYFDRASSDKISDIPFEVYLCHNGEQGLSWFCENDDSVDILIGRIDPPTASDMAENIADFRRRHPVTGEKIQLGDSGIIPVRRPLSLMIARGYAAVGDSAFMTTPMNGMGLDLSLKAGVLLAEKLKKSRSADIDTLWSYNRDYHRLYGGETAKNESLKNALLNLPEGGVDFLFANGVIQASDLAGAGRNTNLGALLGKFIRGMKNPPFFFAILGGIIKGGKLSKAFCAAPEKYDPAAVQNWQNSVDRARLPVTRKPEK